MTHITCLACPITIPNPCCGLRIDGLRIGRLSGKFFSNTSLPTVSSSRVKASKAMPRAKRDVPKCAKLSGFQVFFSEKKLSPNLGHDYVGSTRKRQV